jgi:hypothetical protein
MGPILYTLYSAPLHDIVAEAGVQDHEFADDRQLYTSFRPESASSAVSSLSESIAKSKTWMDANHLKLNEGKTDALVVSSSARAKVNLPPLVINGVEVVPSSTVRNLGVILDSNLTMTAHISAVCRRAFFHLRRIARIKKFLSPAATAQLIHAFVASQLDYGNALLVGLPSAQLDRLQRVQNAAARLITGAKRRDSITPHLRSLHWLPIKQRIDFKIAVLVYKCLTGCAPKYLSEHIIPYCPDRDLRSSSLFKVVLPPSRTVTYGDRSFSVAGPSVWNALPLDVRSAQSFTQFKSRLKTHLFIGAFIS